jgi:hypothetical protein
LDLGENRICGNDSVKPVKFDGMNKIYRMEK